MVEMCDRGRAVTLETGGLELHDRNDTGHGVENTFAEVADCLWFGASLTAGFGELLDDGIEADAGD